MVHIHHSQPLKIKFGTKHFLGLETFGPIQYREGVNAGDICYFMAKLFNQIEIRTNSTTTSMQMLFAAFFICIQIQFK